MSRSRLAGTCGGCGLLALRAANGRGSIYFQKSRGLYAAAVDQGYVNGKRRRKIVFGKTLREVSDKLARLQVAKQTGTLPTRTEKLGPYLAWWIAQRPPNRTTRGYRQIIDNHIAPALGKIPSTSSPRRTLTRC